LPKALQGGAETVGKAKKDFYIVKRKDRLTKSAGKMMPTFYCRTDEPKAGRSPS
jgi:hypothetical protein